ncbi:hypothetical protein OPT61_g5046 [Boeremia exigua]|uniref:Uncharacterized protein n=1 Tax=Boeremia exigua TaxID=749465 RepID=A0ACC2IBT5_9PLEO|nr:hypothetical protein OPT61_g5046 [Boeremia exigua]
MCRGPFRTNLVCGIQVHSSMTLEVWFGPHEPRLGVNTNHEAMKALTTRHKVPIETVSLSHTICFKGLMSGEEDNFYTSQEAQRNAGDSLVDNGITQQVVGNLVELLGEPSSLELFQKTVARSKLTQRVTEGFTDDYDEDEVLPLIEDIDNTNVHRHQTVNDRPTVKIPVMPFDDKLDLRALKERKVAVFTSLIYTQVVELASASQLEALIKCLHEDGDIDSRQADALAKAELWSDDTAVHNSINAFYQTFSKCGDLGAKRVRNTLVEYKVIVHAMSHYQALKQVKIQVLQHRQHAKRLKKTFSMTTTTTSPQELLFEWVAVACKPPMTIKQTKKHVKLANYYHKFRTMFPALPLLQPLSTHDKIIKINGIYLVAGIETFLRSLPSNVLELIGNIALYLRADIDKRMELRDGKPLKVEAIAVDR